MRLMPSRSAGNVDRLAGGQPDDEPVQTRPTDTVRMALGRVVLHGAAKAVCRKQ